MRCCWSCACLGCDAADHPCRESEGRTRRPLHRISSTKTGHLNTARQTKNVQRFAPESVLEKLARKEGKAVHRTEQLSTVSQDRGTRRMQPVSFGLPVWHPRSTAKRHHQHPLFAVLLLEGCWVPGLQLYGSQADRRIQRRQRHST